jgi:hypothetical protein
VQPARALSPAGAHRQPVPPPPDRRDLLQRHSLGLDAGSGRASALSLRGLLGRWDDGDESSVLDGAVLEWADGGDTGLVLSHSSNLGFLACNQRSGARAGCCGASFDIGPDPYPGEPFPTVFFYPCDSTRSAGAMVPTGYACRVGAVAELPKPGFPSTGPKPGGCGATREDARADRVGRREPTVC